MWAKDIKEADAGINFGVFVDDRLFWTRTKEAFEKAAEATKIFDKDLCAKWNNGKGAVFDTNEDRRKELESR